MAPPKTQKRWIIAPTPNLSPDGPIALGNVVASVESADMPLFVAAHHHDHNPALLPPSSITTTDARDWTLDAQRTTSARVGVWATFCQAVVGIGGDGNYGWARDVGQHWKVDVMRTRTFAPPAEFVEAAVRERAVRGYITGNMFRRKVYMVTGVKIASGARGFTSYVRERSFDARVGVDGTSMGVPVAAGPQVEASEDGRTRVGFRDADDFVFAFSLREIRVKRAGGVKKQRQFKDGDFMSKDGFKKEESTATEEGIEIIGLTEYDAGGDEWDLEEIDAMEEENGEECICIKSED